MAKTVIVACKLPNGLILQLRDPADATRVVWQMSLKGSAMDMQPYVLPNSVGLTEVPEEEWLAWEAWADKNKFEPYVKGLIFAASKPQEVTAEAKDKLGVLTGLEGLALPLAPNLPPTKDPRLIEFRNAGIEAATALAKG